MFRAALVALKPTAAGDELIPLACELAALEGWELVACSVVDADQLSPPEMVPLGGSAFKSHRDAQRLADARGVVHQQGLEFTSLCQAKGVACSIQTCEGRVVDCLTRELLQTDILICGHAGGDVGETSMLHSILKHSARPALVLPRSPVRGQCALVAYDGSLRAARAMASFVHSGLARNRDVHVLSLHSEQHQAEAMAQSGAKYLGRHGIKALPLGRKTEHQIADHLLEAAAKFAPSVIVMGAFSKNRAHEFLFGSVTRKLLDQQPTTLLLDH
jgi:nucleotide-binding universal stress UspA family protein